MKIRIGRISAGMVLVLAVAWSPFLGNLGAIFELINQMFSIFAPSIVAVFLFGILSPKGTSSAAFATLLWGSLIAVVIFLVEKYFPINGVENYISSPEGLGINWLRQTYIFFVISSLIYWAVSWTDKQESTVTGDFYLSIESSSTKTKVLSVLLVVIMLTIYLIFY